MLFLQWYPIVLLPQGEPHSWWIRPRVSIVSQLYVVGMTLWWIWAWIERSFLIAFLLHIILVVFIVTIYTTFSDNPTNLTLTCSYNYSYFYLLLFLLITPLMPFCLTLCTYASLTIANVSICWISQKLETQIHLSEITCCTVVYISAIVEYAIHLLNPKSQKFYYYVFRN